MAPINTSLLVVLGASIFGGTLGASFFQRIRVPQVVGYIVIGLIIGESGLRIVSAEAILVLRPLTLFALAVIGFLVGGELHRDQFKAYGKQFLAILLGEGLLAFFLVGVGVFLLVYMTIGDLRASLAAGFVFGAIASATDPASTLDVLWEYRTRGVLTTTIIAIVALDDALAMVLYGLGTSLAQILTGHNVAIGAETLKVSVELVGACGLGIVSGLMLNQLLRWMHQPERTLALAVGTLLLVIGAASAAGMDVILATMALGVTLTNVAPLRSKELFKTVRSFSTPIYVLFFVFVGARLQLTAMPNWLWSVVACYIVGRSAGKMAGAYLGARITHAATPVRRYAGLGLFAQGGIAVGLSIMAAQHLGDVQVGDGLSLGDMIVFCITASTLIIQLSGPHLIKLAAKLADEIGRNVTEEDVVADMTVSDVMDRDIKAVGEYEPLTRVFETFSAQDHALLPVINRDHALVGVITLDAMKEVFASQDTWEWLLARDVQLPVAEVSAPEAPLQEALHTMRETGVEQLIIVTNHGENRLAGAIDSRRARKRIHEELLKRQKSVQ